MSRKPDPSVGRLEHAVAQKMTKKNPKGVYYVENEGQRIGPYQTKRVAKNRLRTEMTIRSESGVTGDKVPELTFKPRGSTADAKFPNGKTVPRVSPKQDTGNSANSRGWDYVTGQPVRKDSPAIRAKAPRGSYHGPGPKTR